MTDVQCSSCRRFFPTEEMTNVNEMGVFCPQCLKVEVPPVTTEQEPTAAKQHGHPRFYEILEQMKDLHSRKNHDYAGNSDPLKNLRACTRLEMEPFLGVMVRLQDKWSRLEEFVKSGKLMVKGESVKDTLMDNAVYSVLAIILYEEQEKNVAG